ncbi:proteasome assembly chaperone family protein [Candidatus Micrarchaeota archaeon]|nr:proteasome assembly chaperone family protein [Candidatus Micrarchaeota archaeon]
MIETVVVETDKIKKLNNPVLIVGLPGIGLIGQVVGRYLVKELKAAKIASLYSHHFPHQVFMTKKGGMRLIKNSFYLHRARKRDLVIVVGDVQALSSVGQYEVAGKILEFCKKHKVRQLVTVGGYSTGKISEQRKIFAVATEDKLKDKFKKYGVVFGEAKGSIVGAAGLIPTLGKIEGMEGICLMGETHGGYVDTIAAREIVKLLAVYLGISVNLKRIDERAKKSEKIMKKIEDEIKKSMETEYGSSRTVSYIR